MIDGDYRFFLCAVSLMFRKETSCLLEKRLSLSHTHTIMEAHREIERHASVDRSYVFVGKWEIHVIVVFPSFITRFLSPRGSLVAQLGIVGFGFKLLIQSRKRHHIYGEALETKPFSSFVFIFIFIFCNYDDKTRDNFFKLFLFYGSFHLIKWGCCCSTDITVQAPERFRGASEQKATKQQAIIRLCKWVNLCENM